MEPVATPGRSGPQREILRWLSAHFEARACLILGGEVVGDSCPTPGEPAAGSDAALLRDAAARASEVAIWEPGPTSGSWLLLPGILVGGLPAVAAVEVGRMREGGGCPVPALLAWGREAVMRLNPRHVAQAGGRRDAANAGGSAGIRFASQLLRRLRISEAPPRFQRFILERASELVPGRFLAWVPVDEAEPIQHAGSPGPARLAELLHRLRRRSATGFTPDPDGPRFESFSPTSDRNEGRLVVALDEHETKVEGEAAELLWFVASAIASQRSNSRIHSDLKELLTGVIRALTAAIDAKDSYTSGHSERVARIATRLAEELGLGEEYRSDLYLMGILHDIGKIGIDDKILKKQDELTDDEYREIQEHVEIGVKILSDLTTLRHLLPGVAHHHESYDGSGYPDRLAGEQIPFEARILAVADAFDAMSSSRPYRPRLSPTRIATVFQDDRGGQWDPRVVQALLNCWKEIESIREKGLGESLMRVVSTTVGRRSGLRYARGQAP